MAAGFFDQLAAGRATSSTGRSRHSAAVSASVVAVMAEVGIAIPAPKAQGATKDLVNAAEVVVTMGHGKPSSEFSGGFEDWQLDNTTVSVVALRPIRDEIERRVHTFAHLPGPPSALTVEHSTWAWLRSSGATVPRTRKRPCSECS